MVEQPHIKMPPHCCKEYPASNNEKLLYGVMNQGYSSQEMDDSMKSCNNMDFYNVCRLCLKRDANLLPLFFISDNLEYKLYKFCNIRVSIEDSLPRNICALCVEKVNKCYRFKVQCERSDAFLRDYFDVEPQSDETDSNIADDNTSTSFVPEFCSCKTEGSDNDNVDQVEEDTATDEEIQIIYSGPRPRMVNVNTISLQVEHMGETWVQQQEDGFRGWPPPGDLEATWQQSYKACLKRYCTGLEEELNQFAKENLQEQAIGVKLLQGTSKSLPIGQTPEGVSVQQKKFKQTPKKKPDEPQRDYFTRRSWSTLQAKQVQFNNELLKPEHLLLNLGLRPQPDARIQSVGSQVENNTLGHVTFKTEDTQLVEECSNVEVQEMETEAKDEGCETENLNIYEGLDTKMETMTENNLFQVESEHKSIPVEEYSINESIDIKEEDNYYYDGTVMEYSNSESEHLNDVPGNLPEVASEALVKIAKEAPQVNVWHWITKHHSGDIQTEIHATSVVEDFYQRLAENSLVTMVSDTSELSSPIISDESFPQLNGYHPEIPPCYDISDEDESPSEEMVVISDVEDNTVEDTPTEIREQAQETAVLETMSDKSENNNSKGHKCKLCGKIFHVWSQWVSHQQKHGNNALYSCKKCQKSYKQEALLKKHIDWAHSTQKLKCPECSAVTHNKRGLLRHMSRHKGQRTHRCNLCHRSFYTSCELQSHFEMHLPKQCGVCNKIFSNKRALKTHVEMHAGIGHKCTICDKIFCRKLYLNKHMQYHSKTSEYKCDSCDRSFLDNNSLLLHKTSMHSTE